MKKKREFSSSVLSHASCVRKVALLFLLSSTINDISAQTSSISDSIKSTAIIIPISSTDNTVVGAFVDYHLTVRNSGTTNDVFLLETSNIKSATNNPDGTNSDKNHDLKSVVTDKNGSSITKVEIESGKEVEIIVRVFVPEKVKIGVWNCTQLKITSTVYPTNQTFLSLFTFAPEPKAIIQGYVLPTCPIHGSPMTELAILRGRILLMC